jgi:hypothetical protein
MKRAWGTWEWDTCKSKMLYIYRYMGNALHPKVHEDVTALAFSYPFSGTLSEVHHEPPSHYSLSLSATMHERQLCPMACKLYNHSNEQFKFQPEFSLLR